MSDEQNPATMNRPPRRRKGHEMTDYEEIYRSARKTAFVTGSHDRTPGYRATGLAAVVAAAKAEALEEAAMIAEGWVLTDNTRSLDDIAYNQAISDVTRAIRAAKEGTPNGR